MNFKSLLCGLAAAAMFTACSNEDNGGVVNPGNGELVDAGYMTVAINLPTTPSSRAQNDQFDDGLASEYAVKNAMLLLFTGDVASGENAAKFHSAYDLNLTDKAEDADKDNITTTYAKTVHLSGVADNDYLWGLVLVNYDNIVTDKVLAQPDASVVYDEKDKFVGLLTSLNINGHSLIKGASFSSILAEITSNSFINDSHFFMTNAVVSTADADGASDNTVYTLQKIGNAEDVAKPTEAEAAAAPAASFYVERAVAKATLTCTNTVVGDLAKNNISIKSVKWVLDNQEPTSYIVRNVVKTGVTSYIQYKSGSLPKRFVGTAKIGTTTLQDEANLYRHYWAIDPTYSAGRTATKNVNADGAYEFKEIGTDKPQYCHENTFPIGSMDYKNTTRALLKVTFNVPDGGTNLYTLNNEQKIYSNAATVESHPIKAIVEDPTIKAAVKDALAEGQSHTVSADDLEVTFENVAETNVHKVTSIKFVSKEGDSKFTKTPELSATDEATLINNINATYVIVEYTGGVAYYDIRFKHFGDEYTKDPLKGISSSILTTIQAYGSDETNYLGRWGMVRNNWYEINLTSIKQLGKPVIGQMDVTNDDTPDDNQEQEKYLSFKINILSWAKRVQNENL